MTAPRYQLIAHFRAHEGRSQAVAGKLRQLAQLSRQEPDNLDYVVTQSLEDPCHFVIVESYRSRDGFDAHRASAHFDAIAVHGIFPELVDRSARAFCGTGEL